MRVYFLLSLFLISSVASAQTIMEEGLKYSALPTYPFAARQLGTQGRVILEFSVDGDGNVTTVETISGDFNLAAAATENVRTWKFYVQPSPNPPKKYETEFDFRLSKEKVEPDDNGKVTVVVHSYRRVEVTATVARFLPVYDCPDYAGSQPPPSGDDDKDFVELTIAGMFDQYSFQVLATGEVLRSETQGGLPHDARHSQIPAARARVLINRFRSPEFWALCGQYGPLVQDGGMSAVDVQIKGRSKQVDDYDRAAPEWLRELEDAIQYAAEAGTSPR